MLFYVIMLYVNIFVTYSNDCEFLIGMSKKLKSNIC